MKKMKLLMWALMGCFLASSAYADYYLSAGMGLTFDVGSVIKDEGGKVDYKNAALYSLAGGYDLPFIDILRGEVEYFHYRPKLDMSGHKMQIDALMVNAYVNIPFPLPLLSPYVGAGLGYGRFQGNNVSLMQGMLGVDAEIFVIPLVASLEYRYQQTNRSAKDAGDIYKYYTHTLMAKFRYEF